MSKMLLINPRKRTRKAGKSRKHRTAAQRAATRRMIAANRARAGRKSNPAPRHSYRKTHRARRRNPIMGAVRHYRRRNPSLRMGRLLSVGTYLSPIKDAAVMGVGAVLMDAAFAFVNRYLPASMQKTPGALGVGDVVRMVVTVAIGNLLSGPTRGFSRKAAVGSLVVQARDIAATFMPASMTVNGLGFVTAGRVVPGMPGRVNANMGVGAMRRPMMQPGVGAYTGRGPAQSPLLSGAGQVGQMGAYTGFGPTQSPLMLARAPRRY